MPTYTVKRRLVSVGRDYDVRDEQDATVFTINGKFRFARTFDVKDGDGRILCSAKEKLLALDQTFLVDRPGAGQLAVRRTTTASVFPMKFHVEVEGETRMQAQGSFYGNGVNITRGTSRIGTVSRQLETLSEIFHVWTAEDEEPALMLTIAMVIVEGDPSRGAPVSMSTS